VDCGVFEYGGVEGGGLQFIMNTKNITSGLIAILLLSGIVVIASADTDTPWDMMVWNTVDLTIILMGLTAIGALGAFIVEFYHRVYLPRKSQKDEDRKLIGSVLLPSIEDIIMKAKKFEELSIPTEVRTKIQDLPKYTEKIDDFNKKIERYNSLLKICNNFITYGLWYVCYFNPLGLTKDFGELSDSPLGDKLSIYLRDPILKGEDIQISWLKDNYPEFWVLS